MSNFGSAQPPVVASYATSEHPLVRIKHLLDWKQSGQKWAMLTAYDFTTARILDAAGIPVLLVGDSAANLVYGYDTTVPITVEELLPLTRAVSRATHQAMVVADLPFGSYESSPQQAFTTAVRFAQAGAHAVKLEGGESFTDHIALLSNSGIPVMAHIGFTPQRVNSLSGFRVQGRGDHADALIRDAIAVSEAGAFAVVMEMVPAHIAAQITDKLPIPTVGIGAGSHCDAQVLVWQDMAGMTTGRTAKFVQRFGEVGQALDEAARRFAYDVQHGVYPGPEHSY